MAILQVNEIFYSIQGEGVHQGEPTVFVRLQGCNMLPRCQYCDTVYAQDSKGGRDLNEEGILEKVKQLNPFYKSWVCITGGEPLLQVGGLGALVRALKSADYRITIETNGSLPIPDWWNLVDSWNADIKCPSSGVWGKSDLVWFNQTREGDQVKFVVGTQEDLTFVKDVLGINFGGDSTILISPVWKGVIENPEWFNEVAEFCKEQRVRMSLQLHKIIWGDKRGV